MEIKELQEKVDHWIQTKGIRYFNELTNTIILSEEVGEFSSLIARVYGEQSFKNSEDQESAKDSIKDELADILFVLICLSNQMNINLEEAIIQNIEKKTKRDETRHKDNKKLQP